MRVLVLVARVSEASINRLRYSIYKTDEKNIDPEDNNSSYLSIKSEFLGNIESCTRF